MGKRGKAQDTVLRQLTLLQKLPRWPQMTSAPILLEAINDEGFSVKIRTIQRDLEYLSGIFPIVCDDFKPRGWCWSKDARILDLPKMDPQTALTLQLVASYSSQLLPPSTLEHLRPHMNLAQHVLGSLSGSALSQWPEKVRVIHTGPLLIPPDIDSGVLEVVYTALLEDKKLKGEYRSRGRAKFKAYELNPLGVVFKDGLGYLVCTNDGQSDIRQHALHRFRSATLIDQPVEKPEEFVLGEYIDSGAFHYLASGDTVKLRLQIHDIQVDRILSETPLSADQKMFTNENDERILEATVKLSEELRWWVLSYGDLLEVLEPVSLRDQLKEITAGVAAMYSD